MVLDAHGLLGLAQQARAGAVVQVDVRHFHILWERCWVDSVVVVLRADLYSACAAAIANGVNGAEYNS